MDKYQTVRFDRNRYSVPRACAFQTVMVKGYLDHIEVVADHRNRQPVQLDRRWKSRRNAVDAKNVFGIPLICWQTFSARAGLLQGRSYFKTLLKNRLAVLGCLRKGRPLLELCPILQEEL